jgi:hypothetical protein
LERVTHATAVPAWISPRAILKNVCGCVDAAMRPAPDAGFEGDLGELGKMLLRQWFQEYSFSFEDDGGGIHRWEL